MSIVFSMTFANVSLQKWERYRKYLLKTNKKEIGRVPMRKQKEIAYA